MAGEINLQELAQALSQLAKQSTSASNNIRTASQIIADYNAPATRSQKDYEKHVNNMKVLQSAEAAQKRDLIGKLRKNQALVEQEQKERQREIRLMQDSIAEKTRLQAKQAQKAAELEQTYGKLDDATANAYDEVSRLAQEIKEANAALKEANKAEAANAAQADKFTAAIVDQEKQLRKLDFKDVSKAIGNELMKVIPRVSLLDLAKDTYSTINKEIATGINAAGSAADYTRLASLGVNASEFTDLAQQNRTGVVAAGGIDQTLSIAEATKDVYKSLIPFADRTKYAAEQMSILASSGIKPTVATASLLLSSFSSLRKSAGMTGTQFNTMMAEISSSEEVQQTLKGAANEQERARILQNVAARVAEAKALGFSTEQAMRLAKQQSKIANEDPLGRFQKAIKAAALASAMGVSGASDLVSISMKSDAQRTDADRARLASINDQTSRAVSGSLQNDPFQAQIATSMLQTNLGNEDTGKNSVFNSSLAKVSASTAENTASLGEVSDGNKKLVEGIGLLTAQLTKNPISQGIIAAISAATGLLGTIAGAVLYLAASSTLRGGGGMGGMGGGRRGRVGGGGMGRGIGRAVGRGVPIVGGLVGAGFAANDLYNGDYAGAAGGVGGGIGSVIGGTLGLAGGPLGAIAGAAAGGWVGDKIGSWAGEKMFSDDTSSEGEDKSTTMLSKQVDQMDTSNVYLKQVAETMPKMLEVAEKQLVALTLTEKSRTSDITRAKLLGGTQYRSEYMSV